MRIRLNEDYYYWCCEWCDTENRVLWARVEEGLSCGACHKKMTPEELINSFKGVNSLSALC